MAIIFTENYSGDYGSKYEFKAEASESNVSNVDNTSKVTVTTYVRRKDSSSNGAYNNDGTPWSITIDGSKYTGTSKWDTRNTTAWQKVGSASKVITHNSDGKKTISISATHTGNSASSASKMGNASGSGSFKLTDIPRYAVFTKCEIAETGLDIVKISWDADRWIDKVQYSLNNGSWIETGGLNFTIYNLKPNTKYNIKIRILSRDSGLWTTSDPLSTTTKDIARLTQYPSSFSLGDSINIKYSNKSEASIEAGIYDTNGAVAYAKYRTITGSSYTFNFTDEELDTMYKAMKLNNYLDARLYISTKNTYSENKLIKINLTGNQKTVHINVEGTYRRAKRWLNVEGTYRRVVRWKNVNGTWKRCI